jgi:hypothetical protein
MKTFSNEKLFFIFMFVASGHLICWKFFTWVLNGRGRKTNAGSYRIKDIGSENTEKTVNNYRWQLVTILLVIFPMGDYIWWFRLREYGSQIKRGGRGEKGGRLTVGGYQMIWKGKKESFKIKHFYSMKCDEFTSLKNNIYTFLVVFAAD